ncbi:MAG: chemotaxis protein CheC [Chthonomonadales bacterium]|nr:chemotaxis protein CheC [Chthonomonadales bacterium]
MPVLTGRLSPAQLDALREVASIGAGHAVSALVELSGQSLVVSVPEVGVCAYRDLARLFGGADRCVAAVYMPVGGVAPGHVAFLCGEGEARELCRMLLGEAPRPRWEVDEMEASALLEAGNILISSFLNAVSELTGLSLAASPPGFAMDMVGAILQCLACQASDMDSNALTMRVQVRGDTADVVGAFTYIPEPDALRVLFSALGVAG